MKAGTTDVASAAKVWHARVGQRQRDERRAWEHPNTTSPPQEHAVSDPDEEEFAAMFEASRQARHYEQGQTIEGTIVAIGPEVAFVNVGGKGEAAIDLGELKDDDGALEVAVGDRIQAIVVSTASGLTLSRKLARGAVTDRQLTDAFRAGLPVEGKVERVVKGGYEDGSPASAPSARCRRSTSTGPRTRRNTKDTSTRSASPSTGEGGRNLVVSRRVVLEEEQRAQAAEIRKSIAAGAVLTGRVTSVRDFGAFVDLGGGVQGLLHISEMGWSRVSDASQVVTPGETITIKVLRVDEDTQKIALGLKQLTDDPWSTVSTTYEVGQVRTGKVTRIAEFGAFVELEPGVEGLAHASTFPPTGRSEQWSRIGAGRDNRRIRNPERGSREEANRRRAGAGRFDTSPGDGGDASRRAGGRGTARGHGRRECGAAGGLRIARGQAPRRTHGAAEMTSSRAGQARTGYRKFSINIISTLSQSLVTRNTRPSSGHSVGSADDA